MKYIVTVVLGKQYEHGQKHQNASKAFMSVKGLILDRVYTKLSSFSSRREISEVVYLLLVVVVLVWVRFVCLFCLLFFSAGEILS